MLRHNFSILSGVVPSRGWGLFKGGIYVKYGLKKQQSFILYFIFTPSKQYNINTIFCFNNIFLTLSIDSSLFSSLPVTTTNKHFTCKKIFWKHKIFGVLGVGLIQGWHLSKCFKCL